jgi:hypothetical protein
VLGDDVTIKDELYVNGASVLPHKSVSCRIHTSRTRMQLTKLDLKQYHRTTNRHVEEEKLYLPRQSYVSLGFDSGS